MAINTEIHVSAPALQAAVGWTSKWVAAKPNIPIQAGLRLSVHGGRLTINAYSENASARTSLEAAPIVEDEQSAVVSARLLDAVAKTLTARAPVTLVSSGASVVIKQGRAVLTLPAMPEQDWPTLAGELPTLGEISGAALAASVARAGAAAPDDPTKAAAYAAMWVGLCPAEGIEILCSNRYQLSRTITPWRHDLKEMVEATPYADMMVTAAAAFDGPDMVRIGFDGSQLSLATDNRAVTMTTMFVENWPAENSRRAVGMEHPERVTLNPADLLTPLKRASLMREKEGPIRVTISEGTLSIAAADADSGRGSADEVDVDYQGPEVVIGMNPDYFAAALAAAPSPKVTLHFGIERRHVTLTCDDEPDWAHVLMPVLLPK